MSTATKQNRDIKSLQPIAQQAAKLFLNECKKQGIDIFVTEYHRSQERQNYLYEQGRSRPGQIVTWTRNSNHTSGYAWDIAVSPPRDLYDFNIIAKAGKVAKGLGIEWGGNWPDTRDTPHFQVDKNWKTPKAVDEEYKRAVTKLSQELDINMAAWYPEPNPKNLVALVQKIGRKLYGINDYKFIITRMKQDGIISNELLWLEHEYSVGNIKSLIKKVAARL